MAADLRLNPRAPTMGVGTLDVAGMAAVAVRDGKPQQRFYLTWLRRQNNVAARHVRFVKSVALVVDFCVKSR